MNAAGPGPRHRDVFREIVQRLEGAKVAHKIMEHRAVTTSEEAAKVRGVDLGTGAKAMVVKSSKGFHLAVLSGNRKLDWKKLKATLDVRTVRLAAEDEIFDLTGLKKGSVPPFGNLLGLDTWFDEALLENVTVRFNAGRLTHSIEMRANDLVRLVSPNVGHFSTELG